MSILPAPPIADVLLDVTDLRTQFLTDDGVVNAVSGVSFQVARGEVVAIVGESGSGKSVTMLSVMGLVQEPPGKVTGEIRLDGIDIRQQDRETIRRLRGRKLAMIFQEPLSSLDPVFRIGDQICEALNVHESLSARAARDRAVELLAMVGIGQPDRVVDDYPHQLSGGMCQRVMLAIAISCSPELLIADEPTTALDISTQAQLLELVRRLQSDLGMAVVWITHDLGIVAALADRVIVMYAGRIVESAPVYDLFADPTHPYTVGLLGSVPRLDEARRSRLRAIPGSPPDSIAVHVGCPFRPRCLSAREQCTVEDPGLVEALPAHFRACWAPANEVPK